MHTLGPVICPLQRGCPLFRDSECARITSNYLTMGKLIGVPESTVLTVYNLLCSMPYTCTCVLGLTKFQLLLKRLLLLVSLSLEFLVQCSVVIFLLRSLCTRTCKQETQEQGKFVYFRYHNLHGKLPNLLTQWLIRSPNSLPFFLFLCFDLFYLFLCHKLHTFTQAWKVGNK